MKLKFTIHYNTAWGESLHVNMEYRSQDGVSKRYDLQMLTDDGQLWTLETAALESRQHPISEICYAYEVRDAEGKLLTNPLKFKPFLIKPNREELEEIFSKKIIMRLRGDAR